MIRLNDIEIIVGKLCCGGKSPFARNCVYHGLYPGEMHLHEHLMSLRVCDMPESLRDYLDQSQRMFGLCGEVIAAAVADWIKRARDLEVE